MATFPLLLLGWLVSYSYRYRKLVDIDDNVKAAPGLHAAVTRRVACGVHTVAHHSLEVYFVHMFAMIAYARVDMTPRDAS